MGFNMPITHTELLEIISNGENSGVEFKRDDIQNDALAKELVAFSNLAGGIVLLGVEDNGTISGITKEPKKLEEWVMSACRDKIRPALIPFYEVITDVIAGKSVAIIRVTRGFDIHSVWHNNKNNYYIRVGTQSRAPTTEELGRLFQQRGDFRAELRPVSGATLSDLDKRRLKDYFVNVRNQEVPQDDDESGWMTLLFNTEIMVEDGITVSGILLFGRTPNRFLPQAGIDVFAYQGDEKDYAANERSALRGPMVPLQSVAGEIVEAGLVEQAVSFIHRNTSVQSQIEESGGRRIDRYEYPVEAIREAIVNALVHRDYLLSGTNIEISIYNSRIDFISPGRLPNGITRERMLAGCRATRNQLIKDVMRDYGYLEHSGMGIPRKIVRSMKEHNGTSPDLIEEGEMFTIRLFKN